MGRHLTSLPAGPAALPGLSLEDLAGFWFNEEGLSYEVLPEPSADSKRCSAKVKLDDPSKREWRPLQSDLEEADDGSLVWKCPSSRLEADLAVSTVDMVRWRPVLAHATLRPLGQAVVWYRRPVLHVAGTAPRAGQRSLVPPPPSCPPCDTDASQSDDTVKTAQEVGQRPFAPPLPSCPPPCVGNTDASQSDVADPSQREVRAEVNSGWESWKPRAQAGEVRQAASSKGEDCGIPSRTQGYNNVDVLRMLEASSWKDEAGKLYRVIIDDRNSWVASVVAERQQPYNTRTFRRVLRCSHRGIEWDNTYWLDVEKATPQCVVWQNCKGMRPFVWTRSAVVVDSEGDSGDGAPKPATSQLESVDACVDSIDAEAKLDLSAEPSLTTGMTTVAVDSEPGSQLEEPRISSFTSPSGAKVVETILVKSPNHAQECSGEYKLVSQQANGQPLWRKSSGAERWLYTTNNGKWGINGSTQ